MMLLALTVERYVSVCHPGRNQPFMGPPRLIVSLIPLLTFLLYLPNVFRYELRPCLLQPDGALSYQRLDNTPFLNSVFYSMYKVRQTLLSTGEEGFDLESLGTFSYLRAILVEIIQGDKKSLCI
jgi:hypothetical protein